MHTDLWKSKGVLTGFAIAVPLVLLTAMFVRQAFQNSPGDQASRVGAVAVGSDMKNRVTRRHQPNPVSAPSLTADQGIQFPLPTENTIAVASNAQLVKMDSFRNPLPDDARNWDCVLDRTTGLVWEVKTADQGLRDEKNYYSWFNPDAVSTHGDTGVRNNGKCRGGISCDTDAYVKAVNRAGLCGFSDWRLPTRQELNSLVQYQDDQGKSGLIDSRYFPHGTADWYWTSDIDTANPDHAWYVLFFNGRTMKAPKHHAKRIRLVRGGQARSFKDFARNQQSGEDQTVTKDKAAPNTILQSKNETPVTPQK